MFYGSIQDLDLTWMSRQRFKIQGLFWGVFRSRVLSEY